MFIRNTWYVAAWPHELTNEKSIARTLLNEPIVLYRQIDGTAVALEDRCCHRGLPLSDGSICGNHIQCGYHGLEYDRTGICVKIPGQVNIPKSAKVRAYPLVEKDDVVWIWMGEPHLADPEKIIPYPWHHKSSGWAHKKEHYVISCNYQLMNDNLMDLSHLGFVHKRTIGGNPEQHVAADMKVTRGDETVKAVRWMLNSPPPPTYKQAVPLLAEKVDRWQEIDYSHGLIRIFAGAVDAGTGAQQGNRSGGVGIRIFDGITPETDTTMHYFWTAAHNFDIDNPEATQHLYEQINITFQEDKAILESQQARLGSKAEKSLVDISGDVAGLQVRRAIAKRLAEERTTQPAGVTD